MMDRILLFVIKCAFILYFRGILKKIKRGTGMKATITVKGLTVRIAGMDVNNDAGRVMQLDEFTIQKETPAEEAIMKEQTKQQHGYEPKGANVKPVIELVQEVINTGVSVWRDACKVNAEQTADMIKAAVRESEMNKQG